MFWNPCLTYPHSTNVPWRSQILDLPEVFSWLRGVFHGFPWFSMVFHGFPWFSTIKSTSIHSGTWWIWCLGCMATDRIAEPGPHNGAPWLSMLWRRESPGNYGCLLCFLYDFSFKEMVSLMQSLEFWLNPIWIKMIWVRLTIFKARKTHVSPKKHIVSNP